LLLSRNYAPSEELAPYIRQHYVFEAHLPDDFVLIDKLMSETAFIRILLKGNWAAEAGPDQWASFGRILLMGPNGTPWRVRVQGPFLVVGVSLRPSGWSGLFDVPAKDVADVAAPLSQLWGDLAERLYEDVAGATDDRGIVTAIERAARERLDLSHWRAPLATMARFEEIARQDSTIFIAEASRQLGLSTRQLERQCYASFGHGPKAILRRSRFLDLTQAMRGFSEPSAEQLAALRYFDQSHLNREFRHFFEMTPGMFDRTPTPLFTAGLKLRADGFA
jgi:AraC-like DNA-binding protein